MHSFTEENYLKAIYHLSAQAHENVSTNSIAASLSTKPASVTDMVKKLADKKLLYYARYQGVKLTDAGRAVAVTTVRKHRLWELFLVKKLNFKWDEVHDLADELEHISSINLIDRLDEFLDYPGYDPHGDPIPDKSLKIKQDQLKPIAVLKVNECGIIMGVRDHAPVFLQYLEKMKLTIGSKIKLIDIAEYDHSVMISLNSEQQISISRQVAQNILVAL
jgi:DtxR family Mn-dependent transcriptional regulator